MPARRSKTSNWRDSLAQIRERDGALELAIETEAEADDRQPPDIVWRVRLFNIDNDAGELLLERPTAARQPVHIEEGTRLVVTMSVGQNRWMFHTEMLGRDEFRPTPGRSSAAIRVRMPDKVERCQRRNYFRISTASLSLPPVRAWPLLDRASAIPIEALNRDVVGEANRTGQVPEEFSSLGLPTVGGEFGATLLNIGGGGVGLLVSSSHSSSLDHGPFFWLQVDLSPIVPAPLGLTTKLCHTKLDSAHCVQAGMSFDFTGHAGHEQFVADQVCRYVAELQRRQANRAA